MRKTRLKQQSKLPLSVLKRRAIITFNAWIRHRDATRLNGRCYTCNKPGDQAGHFIHSHNSVRFDPMNVNLQCLPCNQYKSGNLGVYALKLIEEYGLPAVKDLQRRANQVLRFSRGYLEEVISKYAVDNK